MIEPIEIESFDYNYVLYVLCIIKYLYMFESWKCEFGDVKNPFAHLRCMKNLIALFLRNYLV